MGDEVGRLALLDEAMKRSALVWLDVSGHSRAVWHAWLDGRGYLLTGGGEQPDPGLENGQMVSVVVPSKDTRQLLVTFDAGVTRLLPGDEDWGAATAELVKARLNLVNAEGAASRWATDPGFTLYRLRPTGRMSQLPGSYADDAHRAPPIESVATTRGPGRIGATERAAEIGNREGGPAGV